MPRLNKPILWIGLIIGLLGISVFVFLEIFFIRECMWVATARAWQDENRNGIWDNNESALAGIKFILKYRNIQVEGVSGQAGEATLGFRYGCGIRVDEIEIRAEAPDNKVLTTPSSIKAAFANKGPFDFGIAPLK